MSVSIFPLCLSGLLISHFMRAMAYFEALRQFGLSYFAPSKTVRTFIVSRTQMDVVQRRDGSER
jgi:hypothetical protein